jgi:3-hydroxyisobutyrate dehydrogenase
MRIGLIGAGRMGLPMAHRLLAAGHELTVHDVAPAPVGELERAGARAAADPETAAGAAELTLVSLPTPQVVEAVVLGDRGALAACPAGSALVDMSTGPPELARRLHDAGRERGIAVLDAPVSGGPLGAAAGTLAIMVGGADEAFQAIHPVLDVLGATVCHMGPAGAGQVAKLANNLLAAAQMAALGEAVALARAEGVHPDRLYEVLTGASGDSSVLRQRFPVPGVLERAPASHEWAALFPTDLLVKDVRLAIGAASAHALELPLAGAALARYREAQARGWGELDYSTVARLFGD